MSNSKKISEITRANGIGSTDLLLIDTASGTRTLPYNVLKKDVIAANAAAHNAIFRGRDITSLTVTEICNRISNGSFEDLFIGDYFDVTINGEAGNETVRCILAGFNTYYNNGDTPITRNHAVVVTKNCLSTLHGMNPTNTTEGGYLNSDMWRTVLPIYNAAFEAVFGTRLLTHRTLLTNAMTPTLNSNAGNGWTGASSGWEWADTKLSLLSEIQVYGSNVFSSSFYDTGCDNLQLPLFRLDPSAKVCGQGGVNGGRMWYWLRNVASGSNFAHVSHLGYSAYSGASSASGVRPLFLIG